METYIYLLKLRDIYQNHQTWGKKEYEVIEKHFNRLQKDFEIGKVIHVGRTHDPLNGFGFVLFSAHNLEEATNYMNEDEAIKQAMMTGACFSYKVIL